MHKLFLEDQEIYQKIKQYFPNSIKNNLIDRKKLAEEVLNNKKKLDLLENIIYPQLRKKEDRFIKLCRRNKQKMVILNIPLLFEKDGYKRCHKNIAVIASDLVRFNRFKKRFKDNNYKGLELIRKFEEVNSNQTNDIIRKNFADFIIYNSLDKAFAIKQAKQIFIELNDLL